MTGAVCENEVRPNSKGISGLQWGDEGKGKVVDAEAENASGQEEIDLSVNGGSNSGHTVKIGENKIVFHQVSSGIGNEKATVVLCKDKVLHPEELNYEIDEAGNFFDGKIAKIKIDQNALLCLDTHRAMEQARKDRKDGYNGSTGRGISFAYGDELFRDYVIRLKNIINFDEIKIRENYKLNKDQLKGMGRDLETMEVPFMDFKEKVKVGNEDEFVSKLQKQGEKLKPYVEDIYDYLKTNWENPNVKMLFEMSQAVGLDRRWGVYPDVTASNTCFDGVESATYGIVNYNQIEYRIGVMKATYASSVGSRRLPTMITDTAVAHMIREYGDEYGATTHRERDIVYLDLVALGFYARVGKVNRLAITHMDSVFGDMPIKICTGYTIDGKKVDYQPFQDYLSRVKPVYIEVSNWSREEVKKAKTFDEMPRNAKDFVRRIEDATGVKAMYLTNGPKRDQIIKI